MIRTFTQHFFSVLMVICLCSSGFAQSTISGTVKGAEDGEPLIGVNIVVKGKVIGTISDFDGNFNLSVQQSPPLTLQFSIIGYQSQEIEITEASTTDLTVTLSEQTILGQEVVISASRIQENIMESPVTIESIDILGIQQAAQPDFFDAITFVKGVTTSTGSLTFSSINTRGFATIANVRFVTLIDGMDISAPLLNFPTGNLVGISNLDAESVELVPGAASALYGPNAFNGILFMNSKSPFEYQGLSAEAKVGVTRSEAAGTDPLSQFSIRYAKAFNNKWAFKVNASILTATDWAGNDYQTDRRTLQRTPNASNFDGLNKYGDEAVIGIDLGALASFPTVLDLRRTGFDEEVLLDNMDAESKKFDAALHYRINDKMEALYNYRFGGGSSIYQGSAKFVLRDFTQQFHKLELKGDNFFVRGYMTETDDGDSYNLDALGAFVNEAISPTATEWAPTYAGTYVVAIQGLIPGVPAGDPAAAHAASRATADASRPAIGSDQLNALIKQSRETNLQLDPIGSGFVEGSRLWHGEFNYNFKNMIDWADIQVGGNVRQYSIYSGGTIFDEDCDPCNNDPANYSRVEISEFGGYFQIGKRFGDLKLTGSLRYDKNENFDGQINPRLSAVYTVNEVHNFRASWQTGFRNPDSQAQFIWFPTSSGVLVGSTEANAARYGLHGTAADGQGNSYDRSSVETYLANGGSFAADGTPTGGDPNQLNRIAIDFVQPEELSAIEVGYKGIISDRLLVDINYYHNDYEGFIANQPVYNVNPVQRRGGNVTSVTGSSVTLFNPYTNFGGDISSDGIGVGLTYQLGKGYTFGATYDWATFDDGGAVEQGFQAGFNTPEHKFNFTFANRNIGENIGFSASYRWQDSFFWQSTFGEGIIPEFGVFDFQINYKWEELKTVIKVGGTNLLGSDYRTNIGSGFVGSQIYIAITFDQFLN